MSPPPGFTEGSPRYFFPTVVRMCPQQEPRFCYHEVCEADAKTTACPIIIEQTQEIRHSPERERIET